MTHSVVVGGAGFVGSWVVGELLKDPESKVTIIDNLISSEKWNIATDSRINFIEGSAAELNTFQNINEPADSIYQLACFHGNQSSIAQPLRDLENGLKTTLTTLEWMKNFSSKSRMIYSAAGCAVSQKTWDSPVPVEEIDKIALNQDTPYSISKLAGEMYCLYYANQHNLDVLRVRFQNVYGPREILGAGKWRGTEHTVWRNVIPTFIWKALNNQKIEIFGEGSRDFIYIRDLVKGLELARINGRKGEVYNIASGYDTYISDLADLIVKLTSSKSPIVKKPRRNWDNSGRRLGDTRKSGKELEFTASTSLESGIKETISWTEQNYDKIEKQIKFHQLNMG